jgi:uncharacterized membrane protein
MTTVALFAAVFLACLVEAVEATTIVVAAGATRSWRSALTGSVVALVVLAAGVAALGPAIMALPIAVLRIVVGGLLLVFGLQWLRKAILRASGIKALHDEDLIYQRQVAAAQAAESRSRFGVDDWYAFTLSFKGVLLEGLEVVFIVLTFATNEGNLPVAVLAALAAIVVVVALGAAVRGPLSRVPENTLKLVVGVMLTSFGAFWGAEGVGVEWPGSDAALLVIAPAVAVYCLVLIGVFRRRRPAPEPVTVLVGARAVADDENATLDGAVQPAPAVAPTSAAVPEKKPGRLKAFGLFWYDFVIGDDWLIAAGVIATLAITALVSAWAAAWVIPVIGLAVLIPYGTLRAARR